MRKLVCYFVASVLITASVSAAPITFYETGAYQSFTVPNGVTSILFDLIGANGGDASGGYHVYGGVGAEVTGTLAVTAGEIIWIGVGGAGTNSSQLNINNSNYQGGGFNGGGGGTWLTGSGGGGGATDIYTNSTGWSNLVAIAGGGGGAYTGGYGGQGGNGGHYNSTQLVGSDGQYGGGGGGYNGGLQGGGGSGYNSGQGGESWVSSAVTLATLNSGGSGSSLTSDINGIAYISVVPEPSTFALFGIGFLALMVAYRRKTKRI